MNIEQKYNQVCVNLIVLSKLRSDDRLETKTTFKISRRGRSWLPVWMSRWWKGQTRDDAIDAVTSLYSNAEAIHSELKPRQKERIVKLVAKSRQGLYRMKQTYESDETTVARIDCLLNSTEFFVSENSASKYQNSQGSEEQLESY